MKTKEFLEEEIYYPDTHISSSAYMGELAISSLKTIDTHHTELDIPTESASELAFDKWEQDTLSSADELKVPDTLVHTQRTLIPPTSNVVERLVEEEIPVAQWYQEWERRTFPTRTHWDKFLAQIQAAYSTPDPEQRAQMIEEVIPHPAPWIPVGGRLKHFIERWQKVTNDSWVLKTVGEGVQIPYITFPPPPQTQSREYHLEPKHQNVLEQGMLEWQKKQVADQIPGDNGLAKPGHHYTPMFVREQGNKNCPIADFTEFNLNIQDMPYKMDTAATLRHALETNLFHCATKSDISDAYHHLPHCPQDFPYLRIRVNRCVYQLKAAVFGMKWWVTTFTCLLSKDKGCLTTAHPWMQHPPCLLQGVLSNSGNHSHKWDHVHPLCGQWDCPSCRPKPGTHADGVHNSGLPVLWLHVQSTETGVNPTDHNRILRPGVELHTDYDLHPQEEAPEAQTDALELPLSVLSHSSHNLTPGGTIGLTSRRPQDGNTDCQTTAQTPEGCTLPEEGLGLPNPHFT